MMEQLLIKIYLSFNRTTDNYDSFTLETGGGLTKKTIDKPLLLQILTADEHKIVMNTI
jgi:hypothetical protein